MPGLDPRSLSTTMAQGLGQAVDRSVTAYHRRRLRRIGWDHALDARGLRFTDQGFPARAGNAVDVLIDGAEFLPRLAEELARATSHVHLTGWTFSPELELTRDSRPVVLRNLLAELAERIDVRLVVWRGAPIPVFRPSKRDVDAFVAEFSRHTKIQAETDSCVRLLHAHHEKTIVIDDRVAFVGGIDLTLDGGDPFDSGGHPARGRLGWHDAAVRIEGPAVEDVANHFRMRWRGPGEERLPPAVPQPDAGEVELQVTRTIPENVFGSLPRGEFTILESYCAALRSAERLIYLESQFLWSSELVEILVDKLRHPPSDEFRIVVLLPARPNDGADVSRGQIAALIEADDGNTRFLACTIYARSGPLRDLVYVHSKVGIVDDRWLTVGSANLNERSMFNDSEVNVVALDEALARRTRLRLWAEHLERPEEELSGDPTRVVDELWTPIATEQLELLEQGRPLTHRLVLLPGVSRRSRRLTGPLLGRIYDG